MGDTRTFDVEVVQHSVGIYTIEADSEDEAREIALDHDTYVNKFVETTDD